MYLCLEISKFYIIIGKFKIYRYLLKARAELNFFPSDHDHERNLDHILEARYERDLISDHFLWGTDRKKIRSHEVEMKLLPYFQFSALRKYVNVSVSMLCKFVFLLKVELARITNLKLEIVKLGRN